MSYLSYYSICKQLYRRVDTTPPNNSILKGDTIRLIKCLLLLKVANLIFQYGIAMVSVTFLLNCNYIHVFDLLKQNLCSEISLIIKSVHTHNSTFLFLSIYKNDHHTSKNRYTFLNIFSTLYTFFYFPQNM